MEDLNKESKSNFLVGLVLGVLGYLLIFHVIIPWFKG